MRSLHRHRPPISPEELEAYQQVIARLRQTNFDLAQLLIALVHTLGQPEAVLRLAEAAGRRVNFDVGLCERMTGDHFDLFPRTVEMIIHFPCACGGTSEMPDKPTMKDANSGPL